MMQDDAGARCVGGTGDEWSRFSAGRKGVEVEVGNGGTSIYQVKKEKKGTFPQSAVTVSNVFLVDY